MSRVTDAILTDGSFTNGSSMLDLSKGGVFGWTNGQNFISNQAEVPRNLICLLLEAPKFFRLMPNENVWTSTLKALFELHAKSITGFNAGLTVEVAEHPIGGAGEMQEEYTNVTRGRSTPTFTWTEKYGSPIRTFLANWIAYGMMDPDTKFALIGSNDGETPGDLLADWYTASALFIEPDPTHRHVVRSWVTGNMFPKSTGEITGSRDITAARSTVELSIEFSGFSHYSQGTDAFAQRILDGISITNSSPFTEPSFIDNISPDVEAQEPGYQKSIDNTVT